MSGPFPSGYFVDAPTLNAMLLGWVDLVAFFGACVYVSADAPTFVFSVEADMTGLIEPGMRVRLTQTTDKFFIVTAVGAFSGGVTPITVYGGTDYTLANAAISAGAFSTHKKPFGFNASPIKWTEQLTDSSGRSQASPTSNTWYNPGALSLSVPIGPWRLEYEVSFGQSSAGTVDETLSTANNSESDSHFSSEFTPTGAAVTPAFRSKTVLVAAKTSYFLNQRTQNAGIGSIFNNGGSSPTIIRAVCAYL